MDSGIDGGLNDDGGRLAGEMVGGLNDGCGALARDDGGGGGYWPLTSFPEDVVGGINGGGG